MGLITEYLTAQKQHEAKYGERTVVLMAVGTFYEIYEYDPLYCTTDEAKKDKKGNVWNEHIGHAVALSTVLNSVLTQKDKNKPYGITNPFIVGFPIIAYEKNKLTLLANDYVIVRVDQGRKIADKKVPRFVSEICSPTLELDSITLNRPSSNIAAIYIEYHSGTGTKYDNFLVTTGLSIIDILTGTNRICEFHSKTDDQFHALQELYRCITAHSPRELILHISDVPSTIDQTNYIKYIEKILDLKRFDRATSHINEMLPEYKKISYQIEFFNKLFTLQTKKDIINSNSKPNTDLNLITETPKESVPLTGTPTASQNVIQIYNNKVIEELGLERMKYGLISYMLLIQHCYSHNPDLITRLSKPDLQWIDSERHLILTHNAILQLNLIPERSNNLKKEITSLMSVLDENQTHLGRRMLQNLLQNPMLKADEIEIYYELVSDMLTYKVGEEPLWLVLDRHLKELPDIGRLQRKLEIKVITPKELAVLYHAYLKIIEIYKIIVESQAKTLIRYLLTPEDTVSFNEFISRYTLMINFPVLECCYLDSDSNNNEWLEFTDPPINYGFYEDIDKYTDSLIQAERELQKIVDHLNSFLKNLKGKELEFRSAKKKQGATKQGPTNTILLTTTAKANTLMKSPINTELCGKLNLSTHSTTEQMIRSDKITALSDMIDNNKMALRQLLYNVFLHIIDEMTKKYKFYVPLANLVAKIDLIHSYAKVAEKYNYYRPEIVKDSQPTSFLEARELRHPIVERLINEVYVVNDAYLGRGNEVRTNGLLLFGLNMSGKSSYVKSIALNIIMAQIGCYVPSHLKYKPYGKIITRLSGMDDIFSGNSTFSVEMSELRTILRQADERSLVVGDELAHGTETNSAIGITISAIMSLIHNNASFIFATHLHDIVDLPYITELKPNSLRICHLTVHKDPITNCLMYERKLTPGSGPQNYGILVAESLDLPQNFIEKAYEIVNYITGNGKELVNPKTSRYNANMYVDSCNICGTKSNLQTHHIVEQNRSNEKGFVPVSIILQSEDVYLGKLHKNKCSNLIVLCGKCHTQIHNTNQELETISTINGKLIRLKDQTMSNSC